MLLHSIEYTIPIQRTNRTKSVTVAIRALNAQIAANMVECWLWRTGYSNFTVSAATNQHQASKFDL